jgi:hypothetical protein
MYVKDKKCEDAASTDLEYTAVVGFIKPLTL